MSNRFIRWILSGISFGLAAFLSYVVMSHMQTNAPSSPASPALKEADAGIEGFVYRQTKDGRIQWEVEAQNAELFEVRHEASLKNVHVRLFRNDGEEMVLQANEGMINTETNDFELRNHTELVAIEFSNGYTVLTPAIYWIDAKQEFRTSNPVTIRGNGLTITGIGLVGSLISEEFTVLNHVRAELSS